MPRHTPPQDANAQLRPDATDEQDGFEQDEHMGSYLVPLEDEEDGTEYDERPRLSTKPTTRESSESVKKGGRDPFIYDNV